MTASSEFTIPLFPTGDEGAAFRLRNKEGGEIQRPHIIQNESAVTVQANLFSVLHGRSSPGGGAATLIVIEFQFTGSEPRGRRLRKATIDVKFGLEDKDVGSEYDPKVTKIAPYGTFFRNPAREKQETKYNANISANFGGGPAGLGLGAGWERTNSIVKEERETLSGTRRIEGRNSGSQNAARWIIRENKLDKNGIPSSLRTAILLELQCKERFRAFVAINSEVDLLYKADQSLKKFLGGAIVDPVCFEEDGKRQDMGDLLLNIDIENLSACDLEKLGSIQVGVTHPPIEIVFRIH